MKKKFLIFSFFISFLTFAQNQNPYSKIDFKISNIPKDSCQNTSSIANFINSNFKSENDKIRAVFFWTTSNITYDVASMNIPNGVISSEEKIKNALQNKKGVCIDYAEVFNNITNNAFLIFRSTIISMGCIRLIPALVNNGWPLKNFRLIRSPLMKESGYSTHRSRTAKLTVAASPTTAWALMTNIRSLM